MINLFKKTISITLILLLALYPVPVFAQEQVVEPSPTPEVSNSADVENQTNTESDTGNNEIAPQENLEESVEVEPTPTPDPEPQTLELLPAEGNEGIGNTGTVDNSIDSNADSGNNNISTPEGEDLDSSPNPEASADAQTSTGDALSQTTVQNDMNTTAVESEVLFHTINIFVSSDSNIDLSDPFALANQAVADNPNDEVINMAVEVDNISYLSNDIDTSAITGGNQITTPDGSGVISTGDAYSLLFLVNQLNLTLINSDLHFVTINIFGDLSGDIILPMLEGSTSCADCISLTVGNYAGVSNNIESNAISGQNSILASDSASIETGDTSSQVDVVNLVNTTIVDSSLAMLFINVFGSWIGEFLGWGDIAATEGGSSLDITNVEFLTGEDCSTCSVSEVDISNGAVVENNISSTASSGENSIEAEDGSIITGSAYSIVSLINLINTTLINSSAFFGFINVFGSWTGDIGEAKFFEEDSGSEDDSTGGIELPDEIIQLSSQENPPEDSGDSQQNQQEGVLTITNSNNVGEFVYPGDTVTFFVNINNTGAGGVRDTKLNLFLVRDGQNVGGREYSLGDIAAGNGVKFSTGFVLADNAPAGTYIARAVVTGSTETNKEVSATADSSFRIFGDILVAGISSQYQSQQPGEVLAATVGTTTTSETASTLGKNLTPYIILGLLFLDYLLIRGLKERKRLRLIFSKESPIRLRLSSIRLFLF